MFFCKFYVNLVAEIKLFCWYGFLKQGCYHCNLFSSVFRSFSFFYNFTNYFECNLSFYRIMQKKSRLSFWWQFVTSQVSSFHYSKGWWFYLKNRWYIIEKSGFVCKISIFWYILPVVAARIFLTLPDFDFFWQSYSINWKISWRIVSMIIFPSSKYYLFAREVKNSILFRKFIFWRWYSIF